MTGEQARAISAFGIARAPIESYRAFRQRVHTRVCETARSCTCPTAYGPEVLTEARDHARRVHAKFSHGGMVERCQSPHDVICRAAWPR